MSLVMQDLDASGKLIKDLNILEQRVFKNEAEFLEALKEEYLAQGKTEKEFKEDTEGYSIDGLKVGNVLFVNAQVAAEKNGVKLVTPVIGERFAFNGNLPRTRWWDKEYQAEIFAMMGKTSF